MKELKQVKIKNGKFTLEGKVVEVIPLELKIVDFDPSYIGEKEEDLKDLYRNKPRKADAYVVGEEADDSYWTKTESYYPILYLKIKGEKSSS